MGRFRVKESKHSEGDRTYAKGEVVETERDLVALFGNTKFEELGDEEPPEVKAKRKRMEERRKKEEEAAAEDDATPSGATDDPIRVEGKQRPREAGTGRVLDKDNVHDNVDPEEAVSKLGDDVSDEYPKAKEADLLVLQRGKNFYVADKDDPDRALNEEPLSKGKLGTYLSKQLKGDESKSKAKRKR